MDETEVAELSTYGISIGGHAMTTSRSRPSHRQIAGRNSRRAMRAVTAGQAAPQWVRVPHGDRTTRRSAWCETQGSPGRARRGPPRGSRNIQSFRFASPRGPERIGAALMEILRCRT
jgi:hypothetical protein